MTLPARYQDLHRRELPSASETEEGLIEIATCAEVQAQADNTRAVTPAGFGCCVATEARDGIIEIATTAEVTAGADDTRAVTPLKLRQDIPATPAASKGVRLDASGHLILPAGGDVVAPGKSTAMAYNPNQQNINSGVWTKLVFNTEWWDTQNEFDSAVNHHFVPRANGTFGCTCRVFMGALLSWTAGTVVELALYRNGAILHYLDRHTFEANVTNHYLLLGGTALFYGTTAQDFDFYLRHNEGVVRTTNGGQAGVHCMFWRVG